MKASKSSISITEKVSHILEEIRVVLPGTQALLGFQFAAIFQSGFDKISKNLQYLHVTSLVLIALSIILLLTPASYHRIVEKGKDTDRFYIFASRMVLISMITLSIGLSIDLFVIFSKITQSFMFACVTSSLFFIITISMWFGYTTYRSDH
jgi:hypothetical protein